MVNLIPYADSWGWSVFNVYIGRYSAIQNLTNGRIVVKVIWCKIKVCTRVTTFYWRYKWLSNKSYASWHKNMEFQIIQFKLTAHIAKTLELYLIYLGCYNVIFSTDSLGGIESMSFDLIFFWMAWISSKVQLYFISSTKFQVRFKAEIWTGAHSKAF
jgi:hypothetical protein